MTVSRALRLCAVLLLAAAAPALAAIEPVTMTLLPNPMEGYSFPAYFVNERGEAAGGTWFGAFWDADLDAALIPPPEEGYDLHVAALNERGQVAGRTLVPCSTGTCSVLFLWSAADGMAIPGRLPEGEHIFAAALNNRGAIVGSGDDPSATWPFTNSGFLWTPEGGFEVLPLPPGGLEGNPLDVNDAGLVVGDYGRGTDAYDVSYHGALWRPDGTFLEIGVPGEYYSAATMVNECGQVAGVYAMAPGGDARPFVWSEGAGLTAVGQLVPGVWSPPTAFNELGHVAGVSWAGMWFWSPETGLVGLGSLGGRNYGVPNALNNHDQVVGWTWTVNAATGAEERHAFLWSPTTGMQDLGPSWGGESEAYDISDRGRIVGFVEEEDPVSVFPAQLPAAWTIPDLGPVLPCGAEDPIARLVREVTGLRAAGGLTHAASVELLQALGNAEDFRDGGEGHQTCRALERFAAHVRQLASRGGLGEGVAAGWLDLAEEAMRLFGDGCGRPGR